MPCVLWGDEGGVTWPGRGGEHDPSAEVRTQLAHNGPVPHTSHTGWNPATTGFLAPIKPPLHVEADVQRLLLPLFAPVRSRPVLSGFLPRACLCCWLLFRTHAASFAHNSHTCRSRWPVWALPYMGTPPPFLTPLYRGKRPKRPQEAQLPAIVDFEASDAPKKRSVRKRPKRPQSVRALLAAGRSPRPASRGGAGAG